MKTQIVKAFGTDAPTDDLKQMDIQRREVTANDVEIDILYCGVCHSDIHTARNEWPGTIYPNVPGHEIVGRVTNVGNLVTKFKVGDLAAVGCMVDSCRTCESCQEGLENYCENGMTGTYNSSDKHLGTHTFGGYSEKVVVDENYVLSVPENLDLAATAPLLCAGITTYSPLRHWNVGEGKKVGIVGIGGLGHMGVKLAKAMGAYVVVITTSASKIEDAKRLGADEVILSTDASQMKSNARTLHFILDCVSAQHDINAYLSLLKRDGQLTLVGAPVDALPVALIWTREDDTQLGPFRPPTFSSMKGALGSDGKLIAFQHKVISPTIMSFLNPNNDKTKLDGTMTEGISHQKYEIPNMKNLFVYSDIHVPMFWWRSVTSSTLAFSHECFIDELAHSAGKDPMTFRLEMLTKDSDTKRLLHKLKEVSKWDSPLPKGKGRGVAQWEFFAGLGGHVVEVSKLSDNSVKIDKVYAVIDLGTVVNPDTVKAQMEGAIVMAITAAIKNGITFADGKVEQSNFHDNPVLRINEVPKIEVHILAEGGKEIKGVGEPGLPPVAPALANAIFAAIGKRVRKMPFDIDKLV